MRVLVLLILVLSGCGEDGGKDADAFGWLVRYRDADAGVTCYRVRSRDGISCLRDGK